MLTHLKLQKPATEETLQQLTCDTEASLTEKFARARAEQALWASRPVEERVEIIARFSQLLEKHRDELAKTLTSEVGKPLQQSVNEINGARTRVAFFVEQSAKVLATETVFEGPGRLEKLAYEPLGVVAVV